MPRIDLDGLVEVADGACGIVLFQKIRAPRDIILDIPRIDFNRAVEIGDG